MRRQIDIGKFREKNKITVEEIGWFCGVSRSAVNLWIANGRIPSRNRHDLRMMLAEELLDEYEILFKGQAFHILMARKELIEEEIIKRVR